MIHNGFLIVEKFEVLYEKYKARYNLALDRYAIPRIDREPQEYKIQYRGIDRDCLEPNDFAPRNLAEIRLSELSDQVKSIDKNKYYEIIPEIDFIPPELITELYGLLEDDRPKFETIFVKKADVPCEIPHDYILIGYEPSYFYSDHFSASCDCMLFPRWHGSDDAGTLFLKYFYQLNKHGLFDSPESAKAFLEYYLSFDWTETGDYFITQVYLDKNQLA